jgi:hypothetical protein
MQIAAMRLFRAALIFCLLVACSAPTPHFRGLPTAVEAEGGAEFHIRQRGDLAEAVRVNTEWARSLTDVSARATRAIERATGCRVRDLRGDAAVIVARLAC